MIAMMFTHRHYAHHALTPLTVLPPCIIYDGDDSDGYGNDNGDGYDGDGYGNDDGDGCDGDDGYGNGDDGKDIGYDGDEGDLQQNIKNTLSIYILFKIDLLMAMIVMAMVMVMAMTA